MVGPIVHVVRHAQGTHNLSQENHSHPDPYLTALGEQQCANLAAEFPFHNQIELIVVSPLHRTVDTALLSMHPAIQNGVKLIALPHLQETGEVPCDLGSDPEILKTQYKEAPIDFSLVEEGWNSNVGLPLFN
jgi:broad specificity phosphatase PhoE